MKDSSNSTNTITAVFYGYTRAGKSTLLISAVAASLENKLKSEKNTIQFSEDSDKNKGKKSYFNSLDTTPAKITRVNQFLSGEVVDKTEYSDFVELFFNCNISGTKFQCKTIDYAGELADANDAGNQNFEKLKQTLEQAHCLYLVFDARLKVSKNLSDFTDQELRRGQSASAERAYNIFLDSRKKWPIIILVNKADRLFKEYSPATIREKIEELNNNTQKAKEKFINEFGGLAENMFVKSSSSPAHVIYVAALGESPHEKEGNNNEKAYIIQDINHWNPLGVAEALESGLLVAYDKLKATRRVKKFKKLLPALSSIFAIIFIITFWLYIDTKAKNNLVATYDTYNKEEIEIEKLIETTSSVYRWWHPFLYLPKKQTIFGEIPDLENAKIVRNIVHNAEVELINKKIKKYNKETEGLTSRFDNNSKFDVITNYLVEQENKWLYLNEKLSNLNDKNISRLYKTTKKIKIEILKSRITLNKKAIALLWKSTKINQIEIKTVKSKIAVYQTNIIDLVNILQEYQPTKHNIIAETNALFHNNMCDAMHAVYQRKAGGGGQGLFKEIFPMLAEICTVCPNFPEKLHCEQLVSNADQWDYQEAEILYSNYPKNNELYLVTDELVILFKNYNDHATQRLNSIANFPSRYLKEAKIFLQWYDSLKQNYYFHSTTYEINANDKSGFIGTHKETRSSTYKEGYSTKTRYYEVDVPTPPTGNILVSVDDKKIAEVKYRGFSGQVNLGSNLLDWKPNTKVTVSISNNDTGKKMKLEESGTLGILKIAQNGITSNNIKIILNGLTIPPLRPTHLSEPKKMGIK